MLVPTLKCDCLYILKVCEGYKMMYYYLKLSYTIRPRSYCLDLNIYFKYADICTK